MKSLHVFGLFVLLTVGVFAENLCFEGHSDKNPLLYGVGDEMTFSIQLLDRDQNNAPVDGRRLHWEISCDDGMKCVGEDVSSASAPLVLKTSMMHPGFVRVKVQAYGDDGEIVLGENHMFQGGAGADINQIPLCEEPADFDAFWDEVKAKLYGTQYEAKLTKIADSTPDVDVFAYEITVWPEMAPATGLIAIPVGAEPGSLKIVVSTSGYGFDRKYADNHSAKRDGFIHLVPTRWGENPTQSAEEYNQMKKEQEGVACFRNNGDKYKNHFFVMAVRNLRALQYAMSRPEWDGKNIVCDGGSMGAHQAVALAALVPQVTSLNALIPWVCDLQGKTQYRRMEGWRPDYTPELAYFDTANLAKRVTCRTDMMIGLGDYVCPPSGTVICFRNIKGPKHIEIWQNFGHGSSFGPNSDSYEFDDEIK